MEIKFLNKHNTRNNIFRPHAHPCYELVYFLNGGTAERGGREYPASPHSYVVIPPCTEHNERMEGYGEILFVGFSYDGDCCFSEEPIRDEKGEMLALLLALFEEYKNQETEYVTAAACLLRIFLVKAHRRTTVEDKRCKDLNYVKNYIDQHFDHKISFGDLAAMTGYSHDYFRHLFKDRFGVSPQEYMIDRRLLTARNLLSETTLSCTEIAYRCGFSSSAQMSAMIKKRFGRSPNALR